MIPSLFTMIRAVPCRALSLVAALTLVAATGSGCATWHKAPPSQPKPSARPQHVDAKAQQVYYDLGLQHYSREDYGAAQEAFQQVIDLGPNTPLGMKAQENLRKIHRILKTVEEIESK